MPSLHSVLDPHGDGLQGSDITGSDAKFTQDKHN